MFLKVKFNSIEEFLDELNKEPPPDKIVRHTNIFVCSKISAIFRMVFVVATYLNKHGQVVNLKHYCGDISTMENDSKVLDKAEGYHKNIEQYCQVNGLETRAGVLEAIESK